MNLRKYFKYVSYEDVIILVPNRQTSSTNASYEFLPQTIGAIYVFRDARPRASAFRKYPGNRKFPETFVYVHQMTGRHIGRGCSNIVNFTEPERSYESQDVLM
jgi:hypothetical protein